MKAIMMSIQPPHACNIFNLIKLWEIRKKFPKDYVGWVYVYVTKGNKNTCLEYADNPDKNKEGKWCITSGYPYANGKVVARFWCNKVEETKPYMDKEQQKLSCLSTFELLEYLQGKTGCAIHITNLEIFDEPKEISEFYKLGFEKEYNQAVFCLKNNVRWKTEPDYVIEDYRLTRAPQSWCYVEV